MLIQPGVTAGAGYTFNAVAKTITFTGIIPPQLESILTVVNVTTDQIMFQPQAGPAFGGTWASPTLTVDCSTTGMANGNRLFIRFEDGTASPVAPNVTRGTGAVDANTQRVTLANDGPGVNALASIDGKTPALQGGGQPVTDNNSSLTVDSRSYRSTVSLTRPANVTPYAASSVIGGASSAILTFSGIGPSGGFIQIQNLTIKIASGGFSLGNPAMRLFLFSASPTAIANGAVWDCPPADRAPLLDYIDIPPSVDLGQTLFLRANYAGSFFQLAPSSTTLFGLLRVESAVTFAENSTVLDITLNAVEMGL